MATLKDIANKTGVSKGTVSQVLNNNQIKARISEKTCEKIRRAAAEMGYQHDDMARAIATGKAHVIGLLAPGTAEGHYFAAIASGIMKEVSMRGYTLKLIDCSSLDCESVARFCAADRLSGVICYNSSESYTENLNSLLREKDINMAVVSNTYAPDDSIHIASDDALGAFEAVEYLKKLGHKRIAHLSKDEKYIFSKQRRKGFLDAMKHFGLEMPSEYIFMSDCIEDKIEFVKDILSSSNPPTAFFTGTDTCANLVMNTALKINMSAPEDISVVGFGNHPFSKNLIPALTTVMEPLESMGARAAELLIEGKKGPLKEIYRNKLVVRASANKNLRKR